MAAVLESKKKGITPACAGIRCCTGDLADLKVDHPRVRGDKCAADFGLGDAHRITPACAGIRPALSTWIF